MLNEYVCMRMRSWCAHRHYIPILGATTFSTWPCSPSTYNDQVGQMNISSCKTCPPGKHSWTAYADCYACPVGTYCILGVLTRCPVGTYNSEYGKSVLGDCLPCPSGRYNPSTNATLSNCLWCPAGSFCIAGASSPSSCPSGTYCPTNTSRPILCPEGTFVSTADNTVSTVCTACTAGSFCFKGSSSATQTVCTAGFYCPTGTGNSSLIVCPRGARCPAGSSYFTLCAAGSYSPQVGLSVCLTAPVGTYCNQTGLSVCTDCKGGYNPNTGGILPSSCLRCPQLGMGAPTGASAVSQCVYCPRGFYCQDSWLRPCQPGTWSNVTNSTRQDNCTACTWGYTTPAGSTSFRDCTPCKLNGPCSCPVGAYCTSGNRFARPTQNFTITWCMAGHYNQYQHQTSADACIPCTIPGTYSLVGADSCSICPAGFYCPPGGLAQCAGGYQAQFAAQGGVANSGWCPAPAALRCPAGTYGTATGLTALSQCSATLCTAGNYCPAGSSSLTACPAGRFGTGTGLTASNCSGLCLPGSVCAAGSSVGTQAACPAGSFCPAGTTDSGSGAAKQCPPGKWSAASAAVCTDCGPGTYSTTLGATAVTTCLACLAGYYCPTASPNLVACPTGKWSGLTSQSSPTTCLDCPQGTYQPFLAGVVLTACLTCPPGYYCYQGNSVPYPCLPGTYGPLIGQWSPVACSQCRAGTYNHYLGMSSANDCQNCTVGKYSPIPGSMSPESCLTCPIGFFCPITGQGPAIPCPAGKYGTTTGLAVCTDCAAGSYNSATGRSVVCQTCPIGSFCLQASVTPTPCPAGRFGSTTGLATSTCTGTCTAGYYWCVFSVACALIRLLPASPVMGCRSCMLIHNEDTDRSSGVGW